jgi:hypothetical protein
MNPERVLLLGDTHGDASYVAAACQKARQLACPVILQLGDFGYWTHTRDGRAFLEVCSQLLTDDLELLWLDGNHENHDMLSRAYDDAGWPDAIAVSQRVWHLRRGTRWTWHGNQFAVMGGAASVDRPQRTPGHSWWAGETTSLGDIERLGEGPVDVLLTHDSPSMVRFAGNYPVVPEDTLRDRESRAMIDRAIANTKPKLVVHGHWHQRATWELDTLRIESLASNMQPLMEATLVLDTATLTTAAV